MHLSRSCSGEAIVSEADVVASIYCNVYEVSNYLVPLKPPISFSAAWAFLGNSPEVVIPPI
jgi:hypothetical protein